LHQKVSDQEETLSHCLPQTLRHRRRGGTYLIQWYSCGTWEARISPARDSEP